MKNHKIPFKHMIQQHRIRLLGFAGMAVASTLTIYLSVVSYTGYRSELIEMEQAQLLTMAQTVGKSLVNYINQELDSMDLFFSSLGISGGQNQTSGKQNQTADAVSAVKFYLDQNIELYDAIACYADDGRLLFKEGDMEFDPQTLSSETQAAICGKQYCPDGRYQMFVSRRFFLGGQAYTTVYAMNLNHIYSQIVAPVQIGKGGYSIVKDSSLTIIMHHASDQIGMDAVYDRELRYPDLDLSDLERWVNSQKTDPEGYDVISSYIWDDPTLRPEKRIVAYTTIHLPGEDWIVNSTLPYRELDAPLNGMIFRLGSMTGLFLFLVALFTFVITRSLMRAESQKKEIDYLKEINTGMELLRRKEDEIQHYQRVQSIGQMSSHIAHEFNNYLTPVIVYGELLGNDPSISTDNKGLIRGILDAAGQAAGLSRRLLDFSRQDSGTALTSINLTEDVNKACSVIRQLAPPSIIFETDIPETPLYISGRSGMVEHLLMNLSNNSFHAMEKQEEGRLLVTLTTDLQNKTGADKLPVTPDHDWLLLAISDTGCGISKDAMDKIFEPFYTTKRSGKGTGLGLSVVRNVMTAVGGQIYIDSTPGAGTTFLLYFPRKDAPSAKPESERPLRKILVVDDDPDILKALDAFLKTSGYRCECYDHPAAALSRLQENHQLCDAILTDYSMPSMNGLEFAEIVRKLNPKIRLFLMSGMEDARFEWYLKNSFIDEFILKSELSQRLSELLRKG